jgi:NAD(P)-dependent dehydrogenase (short-subunit alcohol dehydrogenase family)
VIAIRDPEEVAPLVRGALAEPTGHRDQPFRRWILEYRSSDEILEFAAAEAAERLSFSSPITPDHAVRTKGPYLVLSDPAYGDLQALGDQLRGKVEAYRAAYREYVERNTKGKAVGPGRFDPTPRIVVLPGLGIFASGPTRREARVVADIGEHTARVKGWAEMIGRYEGISESDLFEAEYSSLERATPEHRAPPVLEGQVALVTGGGGAIGEGVAKTLLDAGAHAVLVDVDVRRLEGVQERIGSTFCEIVEADVTDDRDTQYAFREASRLFGGVDVVVTTAGVTELGELAALESESLDRMLRSNVTSTALTLRESLRLMELQGTGGHVVVVSSSSAVAPESVSSVDSASQDEVLQAGRTAAIEGASHGVRVNMVNVGAVFGSGESPSGLWETIGPEQAAARGLTLEELREFYRRRNLLKTPVTPEHVGSAVLFFVTQRTPTTGAVLPVDGGLPEAFPR